MTVESGVNPGAARTNDRGKRQAGKAPAALAGRRWHDSDNSLTG